MHKQESFVYDIVHSWSTVSDQNSWDTSTQRCFFASGLSPRPPNRCLLQLTHQILYTNIGKAHQSVPTISTETLFKQEF